jgi:hypothetical protein
MRASVRVGRVDTDHPSRVIRAAASLNVNSGIEGDPGWGGGADFVGSSLRVRDRPTFASHGEGFVGRWASAATIRRSPAARARAG